LKVERKLVSDLLGLPGETTGNARIVRRDLVAVV